MDADPPITDLLARASAGDPAAIDGLIPRIYATLRRLAHRQRVGEQAHTLQTTALVHEAWLQLAKREQPAFADRAHLHAYHRRHTAAMRQGRHCANCAREERPRVVEQGCWSPELRSVS